MNTLLRRRMMMTMLGGSPTPPEPPTPVLPYDAEIEYLGTSGTQYIDTLLTLSEGTTKITGEFKVKFSVVSGGSRFVFHSNPNGGVQVYTNSNRIYNQGAYKNVNNTTTYTVITNTTATNRNITVNGSSNSANLNRSVTDGKPMYIFGSPAGTGSSGNYYYFKIYRNDVLVFDGIPVRVGQVGYMYDRISEELFGNAGSGTFTLGNDKNS